MNWIKGRVLDVKTVTQLNSVRVSFVNRKENGDSLAKAPAHAWVQPWAALRGLCPRAVAWAAPVCTREREWAKPRVAGHAGGIGFPIFQ